MSDLQVYHRVIICKSGSPSKAVEIVAMRLADLEGSNAWLAEPKEPVFDSEARHMSRKQDRPAMEQRDDSHPGRDALAEDRTILASERTFAAWLRTGLAFLSVGLAAQRFLHDVLPRWQLETLAMALLLCAAICFGASIWRDRSIRRRLPKPGLRPLPSAALTGMSALLLLLSVLAAITLWSI